MAGNYTRRISLYINGSQIRSDIKSISAEMQRLTRVQRTMEVGSRDYVRTAAQIRYLKGIIDQHNASLQTTKLNLTSIKGLANAFNKYWPVVMGTVGAITGLVFSTRSATEVFTEFDDKVADVMKVTDMTREQVLELNKELLKLDTRTAQNDLLDLAYVAGKLGFRGKEDVLGFVNAADKISVALAKELGGNAEEAVRAIGKAVEIFDLGKVYGIEDAMLRVGSAVNKLGMSSTAQEGFLISFLQRVAGVAPMAGVSIDKVLGLAAALDRFGQKSEVSATAYSKLMSKMATETEAMAKIMGLSMEDYVKAFTEDANETMLRLFESLGGEGTASFTQLVKLLGESDLEGQRMTQVMGTMVNKVKEIREQMDISTQAMADNVSITNEFNIKNNNDAATLEKKRKAIKALRVEMGEKLTPVYMQGLNIQERMIKVLTTVIQFIYNHRRAIAGILAYMIVYRTVSASLIAIKKVSIFTEGLLRWAILKTQMAYFLYTNQIRKAAMAHAALKSVQLINPWIALASVILGIVAAVAAFRFKVSNALNEVLTLTGEYNRIQRERSEEIIKEQAEANLLVTQINTLNETSALRNKLVSELIQKYPELLAGLDKEKLRLASINQILGSINREYQAKLKVAAIESQIEARKNLIVQNNVRMLEIEESLAEMRKNPAKFSGPIKALETEYNHLDELNRNYLKDIEGYVNKAKEIRIQSVNDEIDFQQKILKGLENPLKLAQDQLDHAKQLDKDASAKGLAENDPVRVMIRNEVDRLQQVVNALNDRKAVTEQIISNLRGQLGDIETELGLASSGNGKKKGADYSDDAETRARTEAKRKYMKGIIKTEYDLQRALDDISLRFMKGRLSQMDKDAEDRAKLEESVVDKEIEIARTRQQRLDAIYQSGIQFSPVEQADYDFGEELKKLNLFYKKKSDMTTDELLAYQALEKKHQLAINKIDADAIKAQIEQKQSAFNNELSKMQFQHAQEIASYTSYEDAMGYLRKYYTEDELKGIRDLNDAKLKIQEHQQSEESELTAQHLEDLISQMTIFMDEGTWQGLSLADSIMSPEEWDVLKNYLNELYEALKKARKEKEEFQGNSGKDDGELKLRGSFRTDILGFTVDDWEKFFKNLRDGKQGIEEMEMAAYALGNAWGQINQLVKNYEDDNLQRFERNVERKKELLQDQLDSGAISQETYNKKIERLDKQVEQRKAEYAYNQAVRERNLALFEAMINTAGAIIEAAPDIPLMALAAAAGALQTAVIASTPLPLIEGKATGGFFDVLRAQDKKKYRAVYDPLKRGWVNQATILAGENRKEYVVPGDAITNPTIKPILDIFEMARLNNKLSTIDMNATLPAISGRASGGYFGTDTSGSSSSGFARIPGKSTQPEQSDILFELRDMLSKLNNKLNQPLNAYVKYQEISDIQDKVESIEEITRL